MRDVKVKSCDVLHLGSGVFGVQVTVPASQGRTVVHMEVDHQGKLRISGGSSIIGEIVGEGMAQKVREITGDKLTIKEFDLEKRATNLHAERQEFKKLVTTEKGAELIIAEIEKNFGLLLDQDFIDYLNTMCQVSVSFVAFKKALMEKHSELLERLREYGFKYTG